jgi:hypothetical protein
LAFKLMDRIKEDRDALKRENAMLKAKLSSGAFMQHGKGSPLDNLLEHPDLLPSTKRVVQSLSQSLQEQLAADLLRWNLRAPTDAHGNAFDINRRALHVAKKLGGEQGEHALQQQQQQQQQRQRKLKPDAMSADESQQLSTVAAQDAADAATVTPPRRKKLVVAKPSAVPNPYLTDDDESAGLSADQADGKQQQPHRRAASTAPKQQPTVGSDDEGAGDAKPSESASAGDRGAASAAGAAAASTAGSAPTLSTSLLSDTNRLIFQEDSPLYRQQLQLQRVRVAQLFARLDSLSDATSSFASSAMAFSASAEALAAQLNHGWEDVETNEIIDEQEAAKMEMQQQQQQQQQQQKSPATAAAQTPAAASAAATKPPISPSAIPFPAAVSGVSAASSSAAASSSSSSAASLPGSPLKAATPAPGFPGSWGLMPVGFSAASTKHARSASTSSAFSGSSGGGDDSSAAGSSPGEDPLSLSYSMSKLASMVSCLASVTSNLGLFLEHLFVTALRGVGDKYRVEAKQTMLLMERVMGAYEQKLQAFLAKKHKDRLKALSLTNMFGKKKVIDEEMMFISALRREMELRRLDHVDVLNSLMTARRLELVEVVCASFMAFVTFTHESDFCSRELRPLVEGITTAMPRRRRFYDAHQHAVSSLRASIASAALPMNLAKIFSSAPCLPIGMNATDWIANMTNTDSNVAISVAASSAAPGSPNTTGGGTGAAGGLATPSKSKELLAADKAGGGTNIGHASLIYTIPGVGVAASLIKPAQVQGYLRMQTRDGKGWKRRWHVLEKGQFFYLRESAFLAPRMVVNVLTCGARPCAKSDMDCVFELISPTKVLLYQAESELDMKTWVSVFANSTEYLLSLQSTRNDTEALQKNMDVKLIQGVKSMKAGLLAQLRKDNPTCAECNTLSPDWISISLGVMVCIVCSGIHRSLGVHISKVRSIVLDDLDTELLDMMCALGNTRVNAIWEATLPKQTTTQHGAHGHGHHAALSPGAGGANGSGVAAASGQHGTITHKPAPAAPREAKEEFIRAKYVERRFLAPTLLSAAATANGSTDPSLVSGLGTSVEERERYSGWFKAVELEDLEGLIVHLLMGCLPDWRNPEDPQRAAALHHAARHDAILATEFLLQHGASVALEDEEGKTPLDYARTAGSKRVLARLQGAANKKAAASAAAASVSSPHAVSPSVASPH